MNILGCILNFIFFINLHNLYSECIEWLDSKACKHARKTYFSEDSKLSFNEPRTEAKL